MKHSTRSRLGRVLAATGATAAAVVLSAGAATAATSDQTVAKAQRAGCPSGYVCVYPDTTENGSPMMYYRYGASNFSNVFGTRLIINNQTGGAAFRLCTGYNGQSCGPRKGPGRYLENLTPINSILLER